MENKKYEQAEIVEYHERNWVRCPYCGRLMFPIDDDTVIKNFRYFCKNSRCRRTMIINVEPN